MISLAPENFLKLQFSKLTYFHKKTEIRETYIFHSTKKCDKSGDIHYQKSKRVPDVLNHKETFIFHHKMYQPVKNNKENK